MFSTSQELLDIAKALSIFLVAVFGCLALYYLAMILRQTFLITKEMRDRLKRIDEVAHAFKEKIESSASYLLLISEGIKKIVEVVGERREKKSRKKDNSI
jgi:hypothetical protein